MITPETQEIQQLAAEFYLLRDVVKALDLPNRERLHREAFANFERLGTAIRARGAVIETHRPISVFEGARPFVVLPNGLPVPPTHTRLDVEHRLAALIDADTPPR